MLHINQLSHENYVFEYANSQVIGLVWVEFTTWDLIHFMRWIYDLHTRKVFYCYKLHIKEVEDGVLVYLDTNNPYCGYKEFLIHRVYNKHDSVVEIIDLINTYTKEEK